MNYLINYQRLLKRLEIKAKARFKEKYIMPSEEIYLLDGYNIQAYSPNTFYLESLKVDNSARN